MSFVVAYALAGAGTLLVVLWVMLYLRYSSQYDVMIAAIDKKQFFLPEIFFIGFGFILSTMFPPRCPCSSFSAAL